MNRKSSAKSPSRLSAGNLARFAATVVIVAAFSQGCIAGGIVKGREQFYAGQYDRAAATLASATDGRGNDHILAMLEYGSVAHDVGSFGESVNVLLKAADAIEKNDVLSVSQSAGSVLTNDTIKTFKPESFERVFVHSYLMMDYMMLDEWSDARVEAKLALKELDGLDDGLEKDPYTRFLAGLAYDVMGDSSDAYIEYSRVIESAPQFAPLYKDLYFIARRENRPEARKWADAYTTAGGDISNATPNNLVVLVGAGRAPYKIELNTFIPPNVNRFVVPAYQTSGSRAHHAVINIGGLSIYSTVLTDVDPVAFRALEKRMPKIIAKELLRVAAKEAIVQGIEEQDALVGLAARLAFMASEAADTRGWETLPRYLGVGLATLLPGDYEATIEFYDENDQPVGYSVTRNVVIVEGRRTVVSVRAIQ